MMIVNKNQIKYGKGSGFVYFEQNNSLYRGLGKREFYSGETFYNVSKIKKVKYGLYNQNVEIKGLIKQYDLPIIHHRNKKKFEVD